MLSNILNDNIREFYYTYVTKKSKLMGIKTDKFSLEQCIYRFSPMKQNMREGFVGFWSQSDSALKQKPEHKEVAGCLMWLQLVHTVGFNFDIYKHILTFLICRKEKYLFRNKYL